VKSAAEHIAEQQLDLVADIAGRAQASTMVEEAKVAELRVLVGIGQAILAACTELRETRQILVALERDRGYAPKVAMFQPPVQPAPIEVREVTRADRGHVTLALLIMACTIAALTLVCIVLALT
jgi:hypothetical protein